MGVNSVDILLYWKIWVKNMMANIFRNRLK